MKVEITDKDKWTQACKDTIAGIVKYRDECDESYVSKWRASLFGFLGKSRENLFPPSELFVYPSEAYYIQLYNLRQILQAPSAPHTGTVYLTKEEIGYIGFEDQISTNQNETPQTTPQGTEGK